MLPSAYIIAILSAFAVTVVLGLKLYLSMFTKFNLSFSATLIFFFKSDNTSSSYAATSTKLAFTASSKNL